MNSGAGPTSKLLSLVFLLDTSQRRVLLGMKKRGFGQGKYNGFGGKMEKGETMPACAQRELSEECGCLVPLEKLHARGRLCFNMLTEGMVDKATGAVSSRLLVHVFTAEFTDVANGEIVESEEMSPQWFAWDALPLDRMWQDDKYWLCLLYTSPSPRDS